MDIGSHWYCIPQYVVSYVQKKDVHPVPTGQQAWSCHFPSLGNKLRIFHPAKVFWYQFWVELPEPKVIQNSELLKQMQPIGLGVLTLKDDFLGKYSWIQADICRLVSAKYHPGAGGNYSQRQSSVINSEHLCTNPQTHAFWVITKLVTRLFGHLWSTNGPMGLSCCHNHLSGFNLFCDKYRVELRGSSASELESAKNMSHQYLHIYIYYHHIIITLFQSWHLARKRVVRLVWPSRSDLVAICPLLSYIYTYFVYIYILLYI